MGENTPIDLLKIHDEYYEGKINLEQAIYCAQQCIDLPYDSLKELFGSIKRENIIELNQ